MLQYFNGVAGEFKQIRWLPVRRALVLSGIVIIASCSMGFVLGAVDSFFAALLQYIVL